MQLTRYTDYGLRVLIYLALMPQGQKASIDVISQTYDISRNNVNKIVHQLGKAGIIETKRGKGGGFMLTRRPQDINIGEMVLLLENSMQVVDCTSPLCKILPACRLKGVLNEATKAFVSTLKNYTLADLLSGKQDQLIEILEVQA